MINNALKIFYFLERYINYEKCFINYLGELKIIKKRTLRLEMFFKNLV